MTLKHSLGVHTRISEQEEGSRNTYAILKARATPFKGSPPNLVPHVFVLAATSRVSCFPSQGFMFSLFVCNRLLAHHQDAEEDLQTDTFFAWSWSVTQGPPNMKKAHGTHKRS